MQRATARSPTAFLENEAGVRGEEAEGGWERGGGAGALRDTQAGASKLSEVAVKNRMA